MGRSFVGWNRPGPRRWSTACTVIAAEPGEKFAFRVNRIGLRTPILCGRIATWKNTFEAADEGRTRVTETWQDDRTRWPDAVAAHFDELVTRAAHFPSRVSGG